MRRASAFPKVREFRVAVVRERRAAPQRLERLVARDDVPQDTSSSLSSASNMSAPGTSISRALMGVSSHSSIRSASCSQRSAPVRSRRSRSGPRGLLGVQVEVQRSLWADCSRQSAGTLRTPPRYSRGTEAAHARNVDGLAGAFAVGVLPDPDSGRLPVGRRGSPQCSGARQDRRRGESPPRAGRRPGGSVSFSVVTNSLMLSAEEVSSKPTISAISTISRPLHGLDHPVEPVEVRGQVLVVVRVHRQGFPDLGFAAHPGRRRMTVTGSNLQPGSKVRADEADEQHPTGLPVIGVVGATEVVSAATGSMRPRRPTGRDPGGVVLRDQVPDRVERLALCRNGHDAFCTMTSSAGRTPSPSCWPEPRRCA